jgi:hypothetical protein
MSRHGRRGHRLPGSGEGLRVCRWSRTNVAVSSSGNDIDEGGGGHHPGGRGVAVCSSWAGFSGYRVGPGKMGLHLSPGTAAAAEVDDDLVDLLVGAELWGDICDAPRRVTLALPGGPLVNLTVAQARGLSAWSRPRRDCSAGPLGARNCRWLRVALPRARPEDPRRHQRRRRDLQPSQYDKTPTSR